MAVKIRLKRMGRKKNPFYRLVAIDSRKRRDGLEIELLGWYNPIPKEFTYNFKEERILHWLKEGKPTGKNKTKIFNEEANIFFCTYLEKIGKSSHLWIEAEKT